MINTINIEEDVTNKIDNMKTIVYCMLFGFEKEDDDVDLVMETCSSMIKYLSLGKEILKNKKSKLHNRLIGNVIVSNADIGNIEKAIDEICMLNIKVMESTKLSKIKISKKVTSWSKYDHTLISVIREIIALELEILDSAL